MLLTYRSRAPLRPYQVISVYNNQFDTEGHVSKSLTALNELPQGVQLMDFRQIAGVFGINLY